MPQLKSVNRYDTGDSLGCSLFTIVFGSIFILMGLQSMIEPWGLFKGGTGYFAYAPLAFLAFGGLVLWGGIHQTRLCYRFGEAQASVSEAVIHPGDKFHFSYQQECRRLTPTQSVGIFLVFRERVSFYDVSETTTKDIDRIIQQWRHTERVYSRGHVIREEHTFEIPNRVMTIRNPFMERKDAKVQTMWVVKVHIDLGKSTGIWKEYEVEVTGGLVNMGELAIDELADGRAADIGQTAVSQRAAVSDEADVSDESVKHNGSSSFSTHQLHYDVFLTGSGFMAPMRIMNMMTTLLPHLRQEQIGDLFFARPCLLLEGVSHHEAQNAKAQLEAVHAQVEVRPSLTM